MKKEKIKQSKQNKPSKREINKSKMKLTNNKKERNQAAKPTNAFVNYKRV